MFVAVFAGTIVLLLLGGGWLIVVLAALLVLLALAVVAAYAVRWHELPLPWLLSRFLTYKTGVRVAVGTVRVRALQSAGRAGAHAAAQTHAVATAEHIVVDNPPGYATRPLSVVGSVEVLFNPWSVLSASVHVQSIHIEAVQVHLERRDGLNNTRALRMLIDARKRARRAGRSVPLLGYPPDFPDQTSPPASGAAPSSAASPMLPARTPARELGPHDGVIISSTSESEDSDSSQDDLVEDVAEGLHRKEKEKIRTYMAGRAAAAAKKAKAAAQSAMARGKSTQAAATLMKGGKALKNALAKRLGKREEEDEEEGECEDARDRSESLCSMVEAELAAGAFDGLDPDGADCHGVHVGARVRRVRPSEGLRPEEGPASEEDLVRAAGAAGGTTGREEAVGCEGRCEGLGGRCEGLETQVSAELSAEELQRELVKLGVDIEEIKVFEEMWRGDGSEDAASGSVGGGEGGGGGGGGEGARGSSGRVESEDPSHKFDGQGSLLSGPMDVGAGVGGMRTPSVSNIKKRLVGSGLKVKSVVGDTLGMAMGGLRRRKAGPPADCSRGGGGAEADFDAASHGDAAAADMKSCEEGGDGGGAGSSGGGGGGSAGVGLGMGAGVVQAKIAILKAKKDMLETKMSSMPHKLMAGWGAIKVKGKMGVVGRGVGARNGDEKATDECLVDEGADGFEDSCEAVGVNSTAAGTGGEIHPEPLSGGQGGVSRGASVGETEGAEGQRGEEEASRPASGGMANKLKSLALGSSRRVVGMVRGEDDVEFRAELRSMASEYVDILAGREPCRMTASRSQNTASDLAAQSNDLSKGGASGGVRARDYIRRGSDASASAENPCQLRPGRGARGAERAVVLEDDERGHCEGGAGRGVEKPVSPKQLSRYQKLRSHMPPFRATAQHSNSNDTDRVAAPAGGSSAGGGDSAPSTTAADGGNVAWGVNGLVMRVARTVGVTGLVMSIIRALDSKLVVIDLVTVHHVYVHVGRLLRALQGDSPHTPSVPNDEEMVRQNEHGQALPRLNFAASTDDQAAASHGEGAPQGDRDRAGGREEREAERSAGAGAAVSGPGVGVGGGHVLSRPLQAGGATRRSDGVGGGQDLSLHEVKPLYVEFVRMGPEDFRPKGSVTLAPMGIPPSEASRRIRERIKSQVRASNRARILSLGGGVAMRWIRRKVRNYRRKDISSTTALPPAAAGGDTVAGAGAEDRGTQGSKGGGAWEEGRSGDRDLDERCRETERTLLECGLG